MTPAEIIKIAQSITYKPGWTVHVWAEMDGTVIAQIGVDDTTEASLDAQKRDGTRTPWRGGTKYLNKHMCRQEIVGAIYGAIKDAEIHEFREWFRYRGRAIDNPHIDPDALWEIAGKASSFNIRENAMTMEET